MYLDYICQKCGKITEYDKKYKNNFPTKIKCSCCNSYNTRRVFSIKHISIPAGNCGNAANGYSSKKTKEK